MCCKCEIAAIALGKDDIRGRHTPDEMNRAIEIISEVMADFAGAMDPDSYVKWKMDFEALVSANRQWRLESGESATPGAMVQ